MLNAFAISGIVGVVLSLANLKNWQIQRDFEFQSKMSWNELTLQSIIFAMVMGPLSYQGMMLSGFESDSIYFTILGAVVGYVAIQSFYTDFLLLSVDRYVLRIGYIIVMGLGIVYTITQFVANQQLASIIALLSIYLALIVLFIISGVGASDIRAITIILPFLFIVNSVVGILSFFLSMLYIIVVMVLWQRKVGKQPVPILPYLFLPYLVIIPLYGYIVNAYSYQHFVL